MRLSSNQSDPENTPLGELYQRHWLAIFLAIRRSIASQEEAEDILLEVFLSALESKTLLRMSAHHQEAWLRRVAYNKCMDFHRRAVRRSAFSLEGHPQDLIEDTTCSPEAVALRQEELAQLHQSLASLSELQQEILRLRFADELPCDQIAARVHKSEGAVRTLLSRTLNHLRLLYTDREGGKRS